MIFIIACLLATVDTAEYTDDMIFIHEWGVVELDQPVLFMKGARWGYLYEGYIEDYYPVEVEAPVIWFHGAECSGTLLVEAPEGEFTTLLPVPDSLTYRTIPGLSGIESHLAVWEDIRIVHPESEEEQIEESLYPAFEAEGFNWAMPFWRQTCSNLVFYDKRSYRDDFIYYECTSRMLNLLRGHDSDDSFYGFRGEALFFIPEDGQLTCLSVQLPGESDAAGPALTEDDILLRLWDWTDNSMEMEEIEALWKTWRPVLATRCELEGQSVIMFPLSSEQTEAISRIRFIPNENILVEYTRLFLGLVQI